MGIRIDRMMTQITSMASTAGDRYTSRLGFVVTGAGMYVAETLNKAANLGKLILPKPVTGSHPTAAEKPEDLQQTAFEGTAPVYAQHLLVPEVTSLK